MGYKIRVEMSDDLKADIDKVSAESGLSEAEILRRALSLYIAAHDITRTGDQLLGFANEQTRQLETEVVGLHTPH